MPTTTHRKTAIPTRRSGLTRCRDMLPRCSRFNWDAPLAFDQSFLDRRPVAPNPQRSVSTMKHHRVLIVTMLAIASLLLMTPVAGAASPPRVAAIAQAQGNA